MLFRSNIMSMGFLPEITGAALDYFGGTNILQTLSNAVGSGSGAAALSVLAGLIGGGVLWVIGKILKNEKSTFFVSLRSNRLKPCIVFWSIYFNTLPHSRPHLIII